MSWWAFVVFRAEALPTSKFYRRRTGPRKRFSRRISLPPACRSGRAGDARLVRRDLVQDATPHRLGGEARAHSGTGQVGDAALVETEQVCGDLVLPVEGGAEHRRVVGV